MFRLKFSNYLYDDVASSINYIKYVLQNSNAAQRLKNEIKYSYKKIKENPYIYPVVPVEYLASKGYRFIMVKNHMLFFRIKEDIINVERFLYGPRDWINILKNMKQIQRHRISALREQLRFFNFFPKTLKRYALRAIRYNKFRK